MAEFDYEKVAHMRFKQKDFVFFRYLLESENQVLSFEQIYNIFYPNMNKRYMYEKLNNYKNVGLLSETTVPFQLSSKKNYTADQGLEILITKILRTKFQEEVNRRWIDDKYLMQLFDVDYSKYKCRKIGREFDYTSYHHDNILNNLRFLFEKLGQGKIFSWMFGKMFYSVNYKFYKKRDRGKTRKPDSVFAIDRELIDIDIARFEKHFEDILNKESIEFALELEQNYKRIDQYKKIYKSYENDFGNMLKLWVLETDEKAEFFRKKKIFSDRSLNFVTSLEKIRRIVNGETTILTASSYWDDKLTINFPATRQKFPLDII
jgi:hypothetical protein